MVRLNCQISIGTIISSNREEQATTQIIDGQVIESKAVVSFEILSQIIFRDVTELEINSTWERFTDTAKITLPKRLERDGEPIFIGDNSLFKVGDAVEIKLGYFPTLQTRFVGFISRVIPELPAVIEIQDITWLLKQSNMQVSFKSVTLKELIDEGLKQAADQQTIAARATHIRQIKTNFIDPGLKLGSFRTIGGPVNFVGILKELKKTYGLQTFAQDNDLFLGSPYILTGRKQGVYQIIFERNVIEHDLNYLNENDVKIKVKAISMLPDNTKLEAEVGDPDGETRTFFTYNVTSTADLKKMAETEIQRFRFSGYRGSFTTFGEPYIRHGDKIKLVNLKLPERNGFYLVDEVNTTFGQGGFRQVVRLGPASEASELTPLNDKINELTAAVEFAEDEFVEIA